MRLGEEVDYVIGVDTHKNAHSAAVVNAVGGVVAGVEVVASDAGYRSLLRTAQARAAGRRAWAVEGTGSFGSGLAAFLQQHGERVLEIERPRRPRQKPAKSDQLDAIRAAREALAADKLAQPRQRGSREALRILLTTREGALKARTQALCQLHALVVGAPEMLRGRLRNLSTDELVRRCLQLRRRPQQSLELQVTSQSLRQIARRAEALRAEAASCEKELALLVNGLAPSLTAEPVSVPSVPDRSSAPGRTAAGFARRLLSQRLREWHRSRPLLARLFATASTVEEIVSSTGLSTPSSCGGRTITPKASSTWSGVGPRARVTARSDAA
jgi:transposase